MRTAFCFDLDGTITTTEILPCIASEIGVSDEIATLTRATMDGHIAFEPSFRLRCLILGQVAPERVRNITANIPLNERILSFIQTHQSQCFIVTGNLDIWISPIVERCGCSLFSSKAIVDNGAVRLMSILDKASAVGALRERGFERIVAVGDGANDVAMLSTADVPVAFGGVHSPSSAAAAAARYIIHEGDALCRLLEALS